MGLRGDRERLMERQRAMVERLQGPSVPAPGPSGAAGVPDDVVTGRKPAVPETPGREEPQPQV